MNYYPHHLGDYAAATTHLSWDEDMAYTRLLRAYYTAEKGIPDATRYRVARAMSRTQKQAVDVVLQEFFTLQDGIWTQRRADEEIAAYQDKQEKAKRSAEARWNGKRSQSERNANASPNAMRTHSEGNAPNPNNQNQDQNLVTGNPIPDCDSSQRARDSNSGGDVPPAVRTMADEAHVTNPALCAVVALRKRGQQWLRLTPDNPEIIAAIGEGVTLASIEAFADAYPDKPPLYVIRAARRERADGAQPIAGDSHARHREPKKSLADQTLEWAAGQHATGVPVDPDDCPLRPPLDVAVR